MKFHEMHCDTKLTKCNMLVDGFNIDVTEAKRLARKLKKWQIEKCYLLGYYGEPYQAEQKLKRFIDEADQKK